MRLEAGGHVRELEAGASIGPAGARLVRVDRWGEYKYSRDPGLGGVFAGFLMVLAGSALLALPAGIAQLVPAAAGDPGAGGGRLYLPRGGERLVAEWLADGGAPEGDV